VAYFGFLFLSDADKTSRLIGLFIMLLGGGMLYWGGMTVLAMFSGPNPSEHEGE